MIIDYSKKPFSELKSQDYITRFLFVYYSERFIDDECYLEEKIDIFKEFIHKYDALNFLLFNADDKTREEFCNRHELEYSELELLQSIFRKV